MHKHHKLFALLHPETGKIAPSTVLCLFCYTDLMERLRVARAIGYRDTDTHYWVDATQAGYSCIHTEEEPCPDNP